MVLRRVTIFSKLAILWIVIWLCKNFTVRTPKCCLHDTHKETSGKRWMKGLWECFANWPYFGHNGVRRDFYSKNSKMSLWWSLAKDFQKTMIPRRLTVFCKLIIVSFVMGFNKNFKVTVLKCRFDERHQKTRWIRRLRGFWRYFAIGHLFGRNGDQRDFYRKASKLTLWW